MRQKLALFDRHIGGKAVIVTERLRGLRIGEKNRHANRSRGPSVQYRCPLWIHKQTYASATLGQKQTSIPLFDCLVGTGECCWRNCNTQSLCSF